jgi:hypothetical protein
MSDQTCQPDPAAETQALVDAFSGTLAEAQPEQDGLRDRFHTRHERLLAEQGTASSMSRPVTTSR